MKLQMREWIDLENIDWDWLSRNTNPAVMKLFNMNRDKINWKNFSKNPNIFARV